MNELKELDIIANLPQKVKIGSKEYEIKSPSLGVTALILRRIKTLLELMSFDISKYDKQTTTLEKLVSDIFMGIYNMLLSDKAEQATDIICEILALLINNSPEEKTITKETIKWEMSIEDFLPLLVKILRMSDLSNFLLLLLKMGQAYDIEQILSSSAKSSSV